MTKVEFTNWLHTEFDAVFHGDITPEQVMLNAIPLIDLFVSKNCGKPIVSGSLELLQLLLNKEQELNQRSGNFSVKESTANRMYCLRTVMEMISEHEANDR